MFPSPHVHVNRFAWQGVFWVSVKIRSCVFVQLDLTACLDFSCLYMFHSISLHFMRQPLAQCFVYQFALKIASRSCDINGNGVYSFVFDFDS